MKNSISAIITFYDLVSRKNFLLILTLFLIFPVLAAASSNQNLIANPGFEIGTKTPLNWTLVTQNGNTPIWDSISHSGSKSIKISIPGKTNIKSGYPRSDLLSAQPLTKYTASAWGKTQNAGGTNAPVVRIVELDANKNWLRQINLPVFGKGTNGWKKKSIEFMTGPDTSYLYVYANIWIGYGNFWIDDVTLNLSSTIPTPTPAPDMIPPLIFINSPLNGQTFMNPILNVMGNASDGTGLSRVELKTGSGAWITASGTSFWNASVTLAPRANTITARATDMTGNFKETSVTVRYMINTPVPLAISSGDGLKINLSKDGGVGSIMINGTEMPMLASQGGFSFREVLKDAPNLISNPGFESLNNWSFLTTDGNTPAWDTVSHSGARSIKISLSAEGKSGYPMSDPIPAESMQYYTFSAWGKTDGAAGTNEPAVRAVELDASKKLLRQTHLAFIKGTNDWTNKQVVFRTGPDTSFIYIYANFWDGYGTFWIDDVALSSFFGPTISLNGTLTQNSDGTVTQEAMANDIDFTFYYIPKERSIELQGEVYDLRGEDRALQVMYNLPVNAVGWRWGDYIRGSRVINRSTNYENVYKIGDTRTQSTYPFASIDNNTYGLSIAVPMDVPRIYRKGYDLSDGYSIQYDFGLSNQTMKIEPGHANFTFVVYNSDEPEWGFRSVVKKYYELYPRFFNKRNEREGTVMWNWKIYGNKSLSIIPNMDDFGFAFDANYDFNYRWSDWKQQYDHYNGLYTFQITEPWGWWRYFGINSKKPSFEERMVALNDDLANGTEKTWREIVPLNIAAKAVINSAPYNKDGKMYLDDDDYFWNYWGIWQQNYPTNPDPDIPSPNRFEISYAEYKMASSKEGGFIENWRYEQNASRDSHFYHSGNYSARIEIFGNESKISGKWKSDEIFVKPNTTYIFSSWGKSVKAGGNFNHAIRIVEIDPNGEENYSTQRDIYFGFGTNDWTQKSLTFTTSATTNKVFIYANIWNGYGQFWLDDVKLYEKWTDENLILNGGMEQGKVMNYSLDGIGFDMIFSDWVWATLEDYRKENWKYIDLPLALNYSYGEPVLLQAFSNYEYLENIREKVNLTYANINTGYNLYAHMLDIMGSEIEYFDSDEKSSYRRTLSYQKTNTNILSGKKIPTHGTVENYIKGGMLYGIYPSINLGKDEDHYWANASIFERDRELFKKYIPIIKEISRAGWEPIPYANSDNSKIKLERFGNSSSNKMYFVLYNSGLDIEDGKVSIEKFLLSNKKIVNLTEIIYSKNIKYNINNQLIELNIRLNPEDTAVYELDLI